LACRATPNLILLRPADGNETSGSYVAAIENLHRPTVIALCRQGVPQLPGSSIEGTLKGAYILKESEGGPPQVIVVGTGSETSLCVAAQAKLAKDYSVRCRVVSMPSWELFEDQPPTYRSTVFPENIGVVSIEAATTRGWNKYAHFSIGLDTFGASAPANVLYKKFGITAEALVDKALEAVKHFSSRAKL